MANMSYCRFRNTLDSLRECYANMEGQVGSPEEARARRQLIELCGLVISDYEGAFSDDDFELEDDMGDAA